MIQKLASSDMEETMEALKKMWTILGGFLSQKTKKHEKHEPAEEEAKEVVKEDPQRRIFRLEQERQSAKRNAAELQELKKGQALAQKEEQRARETEARYAQEICCAAHLLRKEYVPLSAILFNGGIPWGYILVQRTSKVFGFYKNQGTMRIEDVGKDENSWSKKTDYILLPESLSGVLSNLIDTSPDKLREMPEVVQNIFYSEHERKSQIGVEGCAYRQEIIKRRSSYRIISDDEIDEALKQ